MSNEKFSAASSWTYILKASIERLKLFPSELGLSLQLVQPLWLVPHCRQLQITVTAVCWIKRQRQREKGMDRQTGSEKERAGKEREKSDAKRGKMKRRRMGQTLSAWMQANIQGRMGSHIQ